jgi:hypothetical protein
MASVTQRISQIKQPYGGFLPMKCFKKSVIYSDIRSGRLIAFKKAINILLPNLIVTNISNGKIINKKS